jgi:hypothetical protein
MRGKGGRVRIPVDGVTPVWYVITSRERERNVTAFGKTTTIHFSFSPQTNFPQKTTKKFSSSIFTPQTIYI